MKNKKQLLFGFSGLLTLAAVVFAIQLLTNPSSSYNMEALTVKQDQSADEALKWLNARYIDSETGEHVTSEKLKQIQKAVEALPHNKSTDLKWLEHGPDNIGGRTRAILVNRNNIGQIFAGSVSGGLYVSYDQGNTWARNKTYPGTMYISAMAQMQNGWIFVATGSFNENVGTISDGVHMSKDNGETWETVPGTASLSLITELACSPNRNELWMGTVSGLRLWKPGDTQLTSLTSETANGSCMDVHVSTDGNVIVAAVSGLKTFVSTDSGTTFSPRWGSGDDEVSTSGSRIEYAISPEKNASGKYSMYAVRTSGNLVGMNVSHDNGATWHQFVGAAGTPGPLDIYRNQGTYNSIVSVDPTDPEHIFIGGIDIWDWRQQTDNPPAGGFEQLSLWFANPTAPIYVHADNHEMVWDSNNRLYIGNDGGVGVSDDLGATFFPANRGYNVTQFYGIAFDRHGSVMGGTQDNGTLYNDHLGNTYQEFVEVGGGDGFECEISFYNPDIYFLSSQFSSIQRFSDGGTNGGAYNPPYPASYGTPGTGSQAFPFHTELYLQEYYDENSEDSVFFVPTKTYEANTTIKVPSAATGDTILYTTPVSLYYDDTVNYDPALTENRTSIEDTSGGVIFLDNFSWYHLPGSSQNDPPLVDDTVVIEYSSGNDTVIVGAVDSYDWHFAENSESGKIIELGLDTVDYGVAWDTARVQDPYQSWFLVYSGANGGEVWATRNALRLASTDDLWIRIASGLGGGSIDMEFTKDLEHLFIATNARVTRISGLGSIYTSDPDFKSKAGFHGLGVPPTTPPTGTTTTTVYSGSAQGLAVNISDNDDVVLFLGNAAMRRSSNATAANPTFTAMPAISSPAPFVYDGIIDRDDADLLIIGTHTGVFASDNSGASWNYTSDEFAGTPVYEVRQSWRTAAEGNDRPGETFIGTFGRGIWSTSDFLSVSDNEVEFSEEKLTMKSFPNPTQDFTTVDFKLKAAGNATIDVYSISGTKVKSITKNQLSTGKQQVKLDVRDLPKGIYIVKMRSGKQVADTKFMKM